ncbi:Uncharacterised protein [Salmonella enterica subsp. arizonae]|uniref:Uncharacterized protein n=1 Tax=Salmonella enterica subsp. arizonae TaxID=59203 RepID=A0A379T1V9_SALER|nr:Uncharacterised protein [Salmonella enterica subsp. arizonae]
MLPIKSIKLKNFKSYKEQSFDLSGLNVFVVITLSVRVQ